MNDQNPSPIPLWNRNFVLLTIGNFLMAIGFYILVPTLPIFLVHGLKADTGDVGLIIAAFTLPATIIRPIIGYSLDRYKKSWIYYGAFLAFAFFYVPYPWISTVTGFLILRLLHGFSWGGLSTTGGTVVVDFIDPKKRGNGIGIYGISMTLGMAIGPLLGVAVMGENQFNNVFYSALLTVSLGFIIALFIRFSDEQQKKPTPLSWDSIFEKRVLSLSGIQFLLMISYGGVMSFIALYAKEVNIGNPGLFFLLLALGNIVSRLFAGSIFDLKGPQFICALGFVGSIVSLICISSLKIPAVFLSSAFLLGISYGILMPSLQAMVNNVVEIKRRGTANSTYFTALDLGIGLGAYILGKIAEYTNLSVIYGVSAVLSLIAMILFYKYTIKIYFKLLKDIKPLVS